MIVSMIDEHSTLNDGLGEGVSYRLIFYFIFSYRLMIYDMEVLIRTPMGCG